MNIPPYAKLHEINVAINICNSRISCHVIYVLKAHFKAYNKLVKQSINEAKQMYYHTILDKYKNNTKSTWSTIKSLLNRVRVKSEFPEYFMIENKLVSDKSTISNQFNEFYTKIGPNLARESNIASSKSFRSYLKSSNEKNFDFVDVTEEIQNNK